jgi:hypothetical protein
VVVLAFTALSACGGVRDPCEITSIRLTCAPASRGLHCTILALASDVRRPPRDVTSEASWLVSGATNAWISAWGDVDSSGDSDVAIDARFQCRNARLWARLSHEHPGRVLATLRGHVSAVIDGMPRPAAGAHVEVVDGSSAGVSATTVDDGSYELAAVVPGDTDVRAEKPGYDAGRASIRLFPDDNQLDLLITRSSPPVSELPTAVVRLDERGGARPGYLDATRRLPSAHKEMMWSTSTRKSLLVP